MSVLKKKLVTTMPDGSKWAVPVEVIANNRAKEYADEFDDDIARSLTEDTAPLFEGDEFEIEDWAANNMDWDDVCDHAECIELADCDYQEGWVNGDKEVV